MSRSVSVIEGLLIACLIFLLPSSQSSHLPGSVNTKLKDEQCKELTTDIAQPSRKVLPILANLDLCLAFCSSVKNNVEQITCPRKDGEMCRNSGVMLTYLTDLVLP